MRASSSTRPPDELLARRRERDPPARAVEEPYAQLALEALHLPPERLRDDVVPPRGAAEVQLLGECDHVPQRLDVHRGPPFRLVGILCAGFG
jgi:hypothetical protein